MGKRKKRDTSGLQITNTSNIIFNIILTIIAIICLYPLLLVLSISFTDEKAVALYGYHLIPKEFSISAYHYIFLDFGDILRSYGVTIFITVIGSLLSVIIVALYAYPLSRNNFKYRKFFTFFVYFTMLFAGGLVPWYIVYVRLLHLKNTYLSMIIPGLMSAWYVLIVRTFFKTTIPESLIDSAKIDGAGEFYTFFKIVIPLSKPVLATILLFNTLGYWNDWFRAMMFIMDEKKYPLQYLLYRMETNVQFLVQAVGFGNADEALAKLPTETVRMAVAIVAIGPIVFAYPFFQKYFVKGLTIGAVKG